MTRTSLNISTFSAAAFGAILLTSKFAIAQPLQIVNMAIPARSFQMVIYPVAQQKGYMKEEGIDQRVIFVAPTTSIQAMLGGDIHFTGAGSSALVSVARGNTPLKVVLATNDRVLQWFVTKPEITSPKDLKGKRIATTGVAAIATFMARQVLTKHGLDGNKDVTYFDVGQGNQLAALLGGGFDAAILSVEQRYVALDKGMRELFFMGNEVKNSWGTLATTDKLIKENPKMVGGFMRATIKALRYIRQDKEGTISAMVKFANVSRQQANRVYDDIIPTFTRSGMVDDETQRNDLAIIRQVINGNETLPNARGYDFSFASEADAQLNKSGWKP
ncbi:MAG TPA: ABC transporter substrate-binding protein [Candidatus Limnocylindria bacterium]|nr:ABC transporter substrate-binding protein [Candidatus Limnocylindria bacterium]